NQGPAGAEPDPFELEEDEPEDRRGENQDQDCDHHDGLSSRTIGGSGAGAAAGARTLPLSRAIIACVSRRSASGRLRMSMTSVGLNAQISALIQGTTATKPTQPMRLTASATG